MVSMLDNYTLKLLIQVLRAKPPYSYSVVPMGSPDLAFLGGLMEGILFKMKIIIPILL